jgi:hypothetical protein
MSRKRAQRRYWVDIESGVLHGGWNAPAFAKRSVVLPVRLQVGEPTG